MKSVVKHRYNKGDSVWLMKDNKPYRVKINGIQVYMSRPEYNDIISYVVDFSDNEIHRLYYEIELFSTKDELLDSLR